MERRILRTRDAANYVGLAASTLEKARLTGWGPRFVKLGRSVGYDVQDLDRWLDERKRESTSESMTRP
jgi:predicted DNA-binding transcriptional regulator AlpA